MKVPLFIVSLVALGLLSALALHPGGDALSGRSSSAQWRSVFLNRDAATAYSVFLNVAGAASAESAHTLSHDIGAILYERYGLDGLRYCSDDFAFGCYHGLAGRFIEEQGPAGITQLTAVCEKYRPLNCLHGVGHGLMAYMGNDHLNEAIIYCPTIDSSPCTTGIFMEYFLNTINPTDNARIVAYDDADPTAPCAVLTEMQYMGACHYNLPKLWRWWISQDTDGTADRFVSIGLLCEKVRDHAYRASCFAGAGALAAPLAEYDERATMDLCDTMPIDGRDPCKTEALRVMKQNKLGL